MSREMNEQEQFEAIWERIVALAGEEFEQIRGGRFTYTVEGNALDLDRTNQKLGKTQLAEALKLVPLTGTGEVTHLRGPSYIYAILMDECVRKSGW